jgi:hypothetical protein
VASGSFDPIVTFTQGETTITAVGTTAVTLTA